LRYRHVTPAPAAAGPGPDDVEDAEADDAGLPVLDLLTCDSGKVRVVPGARTALGGTRRLGLRVTLDGRRSPSPTR
jgi:hypothetical protein